MQIIHAVCELAQLAEVYETHNKFNRNYLQQEVKKVAEYFRCILMSHHKDQIESLTSKSFEELIGSIKLKNENYGGRDFSYNSLNFMHVSAICKKWGWKYDRQ